MVECLSTLLKRNYAAHRRVGVFQIIFWLLGEYIQNLWFVNGTRKFQNINIISFFTFIRGKRCRGFDWFWDTMFPNTFWNISTYQLIGKLKLKVSSLALTLGHRVWGSRFRRFYTCILSETSIEKMIRLSQNSK